MIYNYKNQIYKFYNWTECSQLNPLEYLSFSFQEVVKFLTYEIEFLLKYNILWFKSTNFPYWLLV